MYSHVVNALPKPCAVVDLMLLASHYLVGYALSVLLTNTCGWHVDG
jgi:hypothetical protein